MNLPDRLLEPEPSHVLQVGGRLASDIGPTAVNNLASGLDFRRTIKSAQDVAQVAARTADPTPKQQDPLSDLSETLASAPVDGTSEPSTTSAKAELQKLAAALDAIRLELDGAGSLPPNCPGAGLIPIYSASGSLITIGRGEVVTTMLAGGGGGYLVQPSAPLPAGLKTQVVGRVLTIAADSSVPDNNYPIAVRDTPSDPERRPLELSMTIVVHGVFRPGAGAPVDLGSGLPSGRLPAQKPNGVAAQGTDGVFANDLLERAANTAVLGPLLGSSFARERDPRQRSESLRRAYAQVSAMHPTWHLPSQPSKTALDMIEDKNVARPP